MVASEPQFSVSAGQVFRVKPEGVVWPLTLPSGRRLLDADVLVCAPSAATSVPPAVVLDADTLTAQGVLDASQEAHWVGLDWGEERALVALTLTRPTTDVSDRLVGARVRVFSAGVWLPLAPRDTLSFSKSPLVQIRFPAVAASRLMVELLAENRIADKPTGVLVPGGFKLQGADVTLTAQPCHLSVAVGDDPPFFSRPGPLPTTAVPLEGVARAVNRYLLDHPDVSSVPLRWRAATSSDLQLARFSANLEPLAQAAPPASPAKNPLELRPELPAWPQPVAATSGGQGVWLSPSGHVAAQAFQVPKTWPPKVLPHLGSVLVRGRAMGTLPPDGSITLALCIDAHGQPHSDPIQGGTLTLPAQELSSDAAWVAFRWPQPLVLEPGQVYWLVLRTEAMEWLWYAGTDVPLAAGACLRRLGVAAWLPLSLPVASPHWLQSQIQWIVAG
jgi:hypothetical protein